MKRPHGSRGGFAGALTLVACAVAPVAVAAPVMAVAGAPRGVHFLVVASCAAFGFVSGIAALTTTRRWKELHPGNVPSVQGGRRPGTFVSALRLVGWFPMPIVAVGAFFTGISIGRVGTLEFPGPAIKELGAGLALNRSVLLAGLGFVALGLFGAVTQLREHYGRQAQQQARQAHQLARSERASEPAGRKRRRRVRKR